MERPDDSGPFYAWTLFVYFVNSMVPETFATEASPESSVTVSYDTPAQGWTTEQYATARIMLPPLDSDEAIAIIAEDIALYPIWDKAMQMVVSGGIHTH